MTDRRLPADDHHRIVDIDRRLNRLERSIPRGAGTNAGGIATAQDTGVVSLQDEGITLGEITSINFVGASVVASLSGTNGTVTLAPTLPIFAGAGKTSVADSDFGSTPADGTLAVAFDTTTGIKRLGIRISSSWVHVQAS